MFSKIKLGLKRIVPVVGACALLIGAIGNVRAVVTLDPAFGNNGKVVTSLGEMYDIAYAVAVQPDGKIVAAGSSLNGDTVVSQIAVVRYNQSGSLDLGFGQNGVVKTSVGDGFRARAFALSILPTGKILVAGAALNFGDNNDDFALVRYNSDGSLDQSFGNGGKVVTALTGGADIARKMVVQPDGKIVLAGYVQSNTSFGIVRYNSDGSLDTAFGNNGIIITRINNAPTDIRAIALQPDGKIILGGGRLEGSEYYFALTRFNANGSPDQTFGNGTGFVITSVGGASSIVNDLVVLPEGKILAAGISDAHFALVRYQPNGTLDAQFGLGGKVQTLITPREDYADAVLVQPNGEINLAGFSLVKIENDIYDYDFTLARYRPNGTLIETTRTSFGGMNDGAWAIARQPDGKLILAGQAQNAETLYDFALIRYTLPSHNNFDFDNDGKSDLAVFRQGTWFVSNSSNNAFVTSQFGTSTDKITPADYDGDGRTDLAVFRPLDGTWYRINSSNNSFVATQFGTAGDVPVAADYDGDGRADLAVFRDGTWYILNSSDNSYRSQQFGLTADKPVIGDFDGDGKSDLAVYRDGTWYLQQTQAGFNAVQFGLPTDKPVAADYDGDNQTDVAVYRNGTWFILRTNGGVTINQFGSSTDQPVPADYDGDGRADIAVFRNGTWFRLNSSNNAFVTAQFGLAGDLPVQTAFLP